MRLRDAGKVLAAIGAMLLAGGCGSAPKRQAPAGQKVLFNDLDKNKDGRISPEEFKAIANDPDDAQKAFDELDRDRNGYLSSHEFGPGGVIYRW